MYSRKLYLLTTSLAIAGMVSAPLQAFAQAPGPDSGDSTQDPPSRVGRLAVMEGTVSYHPASDDHWSPAVVNAPVSDGDAFWTEPQALAKIEVTGSAVWMSEQTEFDLTTLDDTSLHASEPQGEVYLNLAQLQPNETYTLETPRGTVTMAVNGRYDVVAGDTDHPTTVTVLDGAAQITGNNISLQVHANQTASITGTTTFEGSVGPLDQDDFLAAMLKREAPVAPQGAAPPPIVAQMTGGEDLNQYGSWDTSSEYGSVWYPQVDSDYVPYRNGRWEYDSPWGWTWVDSAPWGFAPFHYGRWVQVGPRWGWAPGYPGYGGYGRPVYAPALVSFFGAGVGVGIGVGVGLGFGVGIGGNVGWVPLGFGEPYFPSYRASRGYYSRVNIVNVRNVTNIYNERTERGQLSIDRFANSRGATLVSARAMANSENIRGAARRPTAAELSGAHPFVDRAPVAPTGRTIGLTPRVAQRLNISDVAQRHAPGPVVQARPAEAHGAAARPELRQGRGVDARPVAPGEGHAGAPGPAIGHGAEPGGLPGLRQPGARPMPGGEAARPGAAEAPGPKIGRPGAEPGRPALRAPGENPVNPGARAPEPSREGRSPGAPARTPAESRSEAPAAREAHAPVTEHRAPAEVRPEAAPRAAERPSHVEAPRAAPRAEAPRAAPRAEAPRPAPRMEAPRPAPHMEAPRPAPRMEAPRPAPREAPRPPAGNDRKPH